MGVRYDTFAIFYGGEKLSSHLYASVMEDPLQLLQRFDAPEPRTLTFGAELEVVLRFNPVDYVKESGEGWSMPEECARQHMGRRYRIPIDGRTAPLPRATFDYVLMKLDGLLHGERSSRHVTAAEERHHARSKDY